MAIPCQSTSSALSICCNHMSLIELPSDDRPIVPVPRLILIRCFMRRRLRLVDINDIDNQWTFDINDTVPAVAKDRGNVDN